MEQCTTAKRTKMVTDNQLVEGACSKSSDLTPTVFSWRRRFMSTNHRLYRNYRTTFERKQLKLHRSLQNDGISSENSPQVQCLSLSFRLKVVTVINRTMRYHYRSMLDFQDWTLLVWKYIDNRKYCSIKDPRFWIYWLKLCPQYPEVFVKNPKDSTWIA